MRRLSFFSYAVFSALFIQNSAGISLLEPTNLTTPNLVRDAGYPLEEHEVTTKDGYILTLHRIPYSPKIQNRSSEQPSPIVFMQHGLITSSAGWIALGPSAALGYLLSDQGFDVWLGNSRGNRYSTKHVEKSPISPYYWDFSFHEMGVYDLPAVFDYITRETGVDSFTYIGHSQGTTDFFVYCSTFSWCKNKIKAAHLLAPVAYADHITSNFVKVAASILGVPNPLVKVVGSFNVAPNTEFLYIIAQLFCGDYSNLQFLCDDVVEPVDRPSNQLNESTIPFLAGLVPAGSSLKQFQHYSQIVISKKFRQFDYGSLINLKEYGRLTPPDYELKNIRAPIHFYYGQADFLATPEDMFETIEELREDVVRSVYRVPLEDWNHFDFLYGNDAKPLLYDEVLKNIREDESQSN